jgi:hypothetical protein
MPAVAARTRSFHDRRCPACWRDGWLLTTMDKVKRGLQRTTCTIREKEWSDLREYRLLRRPDRQEGRGSGGEMRERSKLDKSASKRIPQGAAAHEPSVINNRHIESR